MIAAAHHQQTGKCLTRGKYSQQVTRQVSAAVKTNLKILLFENGNIGTFPSPGRSLEERERGETPCRPHCPPPPAGESQTGASTSSPSVSQPRPRYCWKPPDQQHGTPSDRAPRPGIPGQLRHQQLSGLRLSYFLAAAHSCCKVKTNPGTRNRSLTSWPI